MTTIGNESASKVIECKDIGGTMDKTGAALGYLMAGAALCAVSLSKAYAETPAELAAAVAPALKCAELAGMKIGDTGVITKAEQVPDAPPNTVRPQPASPLTISVAIPGYCRAEGAIDQRVGVDGKPYAIGFAMALPNPWNGRFLYQGGGGMNGSIRPPIGSGAIGEVPGVARGFAVVSTDSGHQGAVFDASFMKDQEAAMNFSTASVGKVTLAAKEIIARYYARPARRSYFIGCSTGGREGMVASQRYPREFDGIVSGDPAMRTGHFNIGLAWANVAFTEAAPKDESGKADPTKVFSQSDRKLVTDSIVQACDDADGQKDGMIFNVNACKFDPAVLTCGSAKTSACLSAQQVNVLKIAFAGPKNSRGNQVYPPFPWDSGLAAEGVSIPGILVTAAKTPTGPPSRDSIDVDQAEERVLSDGMERATNTANWTNLSTFFGHGGKLLFYHGWSDPWFSPLDTLDYYQRLAKASGGLDQLRENSSRFFVVPGMGHCSSGPATLDRFDMLGAVVDWVEQGKAPDAVIATGKAFPNRSRPLCAYPQYAKYKGQGNPEDAANFECRQ